MKHRWLQILANLLVVGCALDACVSLLAEGWRTATGSALLVNPRNGLALLVSYGALLFLPALGLTPRLPLSVFLPLVLSTLWLNSGAAPLPLFVESPASLGLVLAAVQVAVSVALLLRIRRLNGGRGGLFTADSFRGPAVSMRHSLAFAATAFFLLLPAGILYIFVWIATWLQLGTQGFVSFDLTGVSLADRRYVRGDRQIRLVGMMHLGEGEAYRKLVSSFATESTIVLAEGVSDDRALLRQPLSYAKAAEVFGLEQQQDLRRYLEGHTGGEPSERPIIQPADLDLSDFAPETIEWLQWVASVLNSRGPVEASVGIFHRLNERQEEWAIVERDVLQRRNEHLLGEIQDALHDFEHVIVPWGGLHLPFIEAAVLEQGFEPTARDRHRLISWPTLAAAFF